MSPNKIILWLARWLFITDILVLLSQQIDAWPIKVVTFVNIALLPGAAFLWVLRVKIASLLEGLVYSFGLSLLLLMLSGLVSNELLYLFGVKRPLELPGIWAALNLLVIACVAVGARINRETIRFKKITWPQFPITTWLTIVLASVLPVLATFGAFRLNNGGNALVAGATLVGATIMLVWALILRNKLSDNSLGFVIFMIALSILLMTSLRSWDISGHDIMREFHVYALTHVRGHWDIGAYRDPYNACLSITILPEMFARLLHISGIVVFKLILQTIFAACVVAIYLMLRRFGSKLVALSGCALFISYPTFINDSAMLTRQGVAYLFFALGLLAILRSDNARVHRWLFLLCSLGVILSHYSTTYMFIAIFGMALVSKLLIQKLRRWPRDWRSHQFSALSPGILLIIVLTTFLWYSQFTATSGGLSRTIATSIANVPHLMSADNKSTDTSAVLFLAAHRTQVDIYQAYLARPTTSNKIVEAAQYQPQISGDDLPLTRIGQKLTRVGIRPSISNDLRQNFAKILQFLATISVLYFAYTRIFRVKTASPHRVVIKMSRLRPKRILRRPSSNAATSERSSLIAPESLPEMVPKLPQSGLLPLDLISLSLGGVALLVLMAVMPTISVNYGVLRAFQQSLIFLLVPITLFLALLVRRLRQWIKVALAGLLLSGLFLLFSGVFAQLTGGVPGSFTMNNHGLYYGLYYTSKADLRAYDWAKSVLPRRSDVRSASFAKAIMHDPSYPYYRTGILPSQRPADSYVYLNEAELVRQKFYVYHDSSPLITTFPLDYYQDWSNQVYSTSTTGIFR